MSSKNAGKVRAGAVAAALSLVFIASQAMAANHCLIMSIGNYSNPNASLPGIDIDERNAAKIAEAMGVNEGSIYYLRDSQMSDNGVAAAFSQLNNKITRGDNVFIYYSGHGTQRDAASGGAKCSEGMVTYDMKMFSDSRIQDALSALADKAGQLVFMNDSCFSGGQAEAKSASRSAGAKVSKSYKLYESVSNTPGYSCGDAINAKMTRNLVPVAQKKGANLLYVAATQDNEVASATNHGSAATLAWLECMKPESDSNSSNTLSGEEIRVCAQRYLDKNNFSQHITLVGNKDLPVSFVGNGLLPEVNSGQAAAAALADIRNGASPEIQVALRVASSRMKINSDALDFSVTTSKAGYLTILQVGSDGKTFNRLFPNELDQNNYIQPGTVRLPHASWALKAGGPAGTSHLLAVVSDTPRDFAAGMREEGPFRSGNSTRNLVVVATGVNSNDPGRYGASDVVAIEEY